MSGGPFLDTDGRRSRRLEKERRRRARRRLVLLVLAAVAVAVPVGLLVTSGLGGEPSASSGAPAGQVAAAPDPDASAVPALPGQAANGPLPGAVDLADTEDPVKLRFKRMPRAGLLVDLDTGEVLWRHRADRAFPIASLTKLMTALVAVEALGPRDKARITPSVLAYSGSGVGVLPRGKRVRTETLLNGLMLVSGNDAARALAFRAAGGIAPFVARMNRRAAAMGLRCTQFAGVEGLSPRNRSCPADLAVLMKAVLDEPRLSRIVKRRRTILPFPVKGGRLHLSNSNPLLRQGYPGVLGGKTGYTDEAGRCLVVVARRGGRRLAAVVLRSPDPGTQSRQLLDRGFRAVR